MTPRAFLLRLLPLVGVAVLAAQLFIWLPHAWLPQHEDRPGRRLDWQVYQVAAASLAAGGSAYAACPDLGPRLPPDCMMYPPPFAAALKPAGVLSPVAFQRLTYVLLLAAFWAFAGALSRLATGRLSFDAALIAGAALAVVPGWRVSMSFGNADVLIWGLVAWGLSSEVAIALLVVAAALKGWPLVPVAVLVLRRPARLRVVALTAMPILAATVAVLGPAGFRDWLRFGLPVMNAGTFAWSNMSLSIAVLRVLGVISAPVWLAIAPLLGATVAGLALRRRDHRLQAIGAGLAGYWFSPICWWYQAPLLLIPIALAWRSYREVPRVPPDRQLDVARD